MNAPAPAPATALSTDLRRLTRIEPWRNTAVVAVDQAAGPMGIFMLVMLDHYHADGLAPWVAASGSFGLLLTPLSLPLIAALGLAINRAIAAIMLLGACSLIFAALLPGPVGFLSGVLPAGVLMGTLVPLVTELWRQGCPAVGRGQRFGRASRFAAFGGLGMLLLLWWLLRNSWDGYPWALGGLAVVLVLGSGLALRLPGGPLPAVRRRPFGAMRWLWLDQRFGYMNVVWSLLGFAIFLTSPLRAAYVHEHHAALAYTKGDMILLTTLIPMVVAPLTMPLWGHIYDRMHFIVIRVCLNIVFGISIALFFFPHPAMQVASMLLFGIGSGGGAVAWNLWVTRYAPPDHAADYMSVHTCMTGMRGVAGCLLSLYAGQQLGVGPTATLAVGLVVVATLLLLPLLRHERGAAVTSG